MLDLTMQWHLVRHNKYILVYFHNLVYLFCYGDRPCVEVVDVVATFHLLSERIMERMNFLVWEITFLHCLVVMRDTTVLGTASGIL